MGLAKAVFIRAGNRKREIEKPVCRFRFPVQKLEFSRHSYPLDKTCVTHIFSPSTPTSLITSQRTTHAQHKLIIGVPRCDDTRGGEGHNNQPTLLSFQLTTQYIILDYIIILCSILVDF